MILYIFRRDFRTFDNRAFERCIDESIRTQQKVLPIFVFNETQASSKKNAYFSERAYNFMVDALAELKTTSLKELTFYKCKDSKDEISLLEQLIDLLNIESIFFNGDVTPFARYRDSLIENMNTKVKIHKSTDEYSLVDPTTMEKPYRKFTPFYNKYLNSIEISKSDSNIDKRKKVDFVSGPFITLDYCFLHDEDGKDFHKRNVKNHRQDALKILHDIVKRKDFLEYDKTRDDMGDPNGTTKLSVYIKFGCVGVREVFRAIEKAHSREHGLIRELFWRSFYDQVAYHYERVLRGQVSSKKNGSLVEKFDDIKWAPRSESEKRFKAFTTGRTGFELVDAAILEMLSTGRMHNRGRMLTASVLVKTLRVDWRLGERFFANNLIDYDPCSNSGGWQWAAGGGADSMMYSRFFSPYRQAEKHDPQGTYVATWLRSSDVYNDGDYPKEPIVDMKTEHEKTRNALLRH